MFYLQENGVFILTLVDFQIFVNSCMCNFLTLLNLVSHLLNCCKIVIMLIPCITPRKLPDS